MWWGTARTSWLAAKWPWSRRNASRTKCWNFHSMTSLKSSCVLTGHVCPLRCGWRWLLVKAGGHPIRSRQGVQFICRVYFQEIKVASSNARPDFCLPWMNIHRWIWIHASGVLHGSLTGFVRGCVWMCVLPCLKWVNVLPTIVTIDSLMVESWRWHDCSWPNASEDRLWRNLVAPGSILDKMDLHWQFFRVHNIRRLLTLARISVFPNCI